MSTYNKLLELICKDEESDITWKFCCIVSHQCPLDKNHLVYNSSQFNVMVERENGEINSEPLQVIASDDPVTCAIYAKENDLLDTSGWKRFKSLAKHEKKFTRMVNMAKMRSFNNSPRYKYGFEVPRTYSQAMVLDDINKNHCWKD
jgi:hypothetical protein